MLDHICFTMLSCSGLSSFIICSSMPGRTSLCCVMLVLIRICYVLGYVGFVRLYLVMWDCTRLCDTVLGYVRLF